MKRIPRSILSLLLCAFGAVAFAQTALPKTCGPNHDQQCVAGGVPHQPDDATQIAQLEAEVKQLKDTVSTDAIVISNLRMSLLQSQAGQVSTEKQRAIAALQAANPGMRWDETSGKMVPIPPPAKETPKK